MPNRSITVRVPQATRDALTALIASREASRVIIADACLLDAQIVAFYLMRAKAQGCPARLDIVPTPDLAAAAAAIGVTVNDLLRAGAMRTAFNEETEAAEIAAAQG